MDMPNVVIGETRNDERLVSPLVTTEQIKIAVGRTRNCIADRIPFARQIIENERNSKIKLEVFHVNIVYILSRRMYGREITFPYNYSRNEMR